MSPWHCQVQSSSHLMAGLKKHIKAIHLLLDILKIQKPPWQGEACCAPQWQVYAYFGPSHLSIVHLCTATMAQHWKSEDFIQEVDLERLRHLQHSSTVQSCLNALDFQSHGPDDGKAPDPKSHQRDQEQIGR